MTRSTTSPASPAETGPTAAPMDIADAAREAKAASRALAAASAEQKNRLLTELASALEAAEPEILQANAEDIAAAEADGLSGPKLARLRLTADGLKQMADGLRQIAELPDPVNTATREYDVPSGLHVKKIRSPLGVVAMIYEARPGVTVDAFALCAKAGNACILKGGKEANRSNATLARIVRGVLESVGLPGGAIQQLTSVGRDDIRRLLGFNEYIDLVIPRGGAALIRFVAANSTIPTVQHFHGVCHVYIDAAADLEMAQRIALTGKTSAPATCNSAECLLVHESVAAAFLPKFAAAAKQAGVTLRADPEAKAYLTAAEAEAATDDDWGHEYLDLIYAVKVVPSIDAAIEHIHTFASDHTEVIVTGEASAADRFCREVQSSCVLVNASPRFNDGFQLGLGAEIGISTSRIHAYGPMGVEELTCERFVVEGTGQTR